MALGFAQKKTNFLVLQNRLFCVDGSLPTCLPLRLQGGAVDLLSTKVNFVDFAGVGDVFEGLASRTMKSAFFPAATMPVLMCAASAESRVAAMPSRRAFRL